MLIKILKSSGIFSLVVLVLAGCGKSEAALAKDDCSIIKKAYDNSLGKSRWYPVQMPYELRLIQRDLKSDNLRDAVKELSTWEENQLGWGCTTQGCENREIFLERERMDSMRESNQIYIQSLCQSLGINLLENWF